MPRRLPYEEWPPDLQRPEVRGVFVGGCVKKSETTGKHKRMNDFAHAHCGLTDRNKRWICFRAEKFLSNRPLVLHELAHVLTGEGHNDAWRECLLGLGGTLYSGLAMRSFEKKNRRPGIPAAEVISLDLQDAVVTYHPRVFSVSDSNDLRVALRLFVDWQQESMTIFGREQPFPRLTAWYGDPSAAYTYSGKTREPLPWLPPLMEIKSKVEALANTTFNSVLLNLYRDGQDSMGLHADDEPELGEDPIIASVSFGATRTFRFRHKTIKGLTSAIDLEDGSVLVMAGGCQANWKHELPKTTREVGERINLTFRRIVRV